MKNIFSSHTIVVLLITLLVACNKQGPDGPEGPEGPAGNPGSSVSGGGAGIAKAYTTQGANIEFKWEYNGSGRFRLGRRTGSSGGYDDTYYIPDGDGVIPDGLVLVYVNMKPTTGAYAWINIPYFWGEAVSASEFYESFISYNNQTGNNDYASVYINADIKQASPSVVVQPAYTANGVKVIVIPAGVTGTMGGRYSQESLKNLTLEQVMERYNIKEEDFQQIR